MEVHHHPEVEKKGFKEYLLEGLMIFIAVMMGFFAESVRENISDREHVKQLAVQLVSDMKTDTAALHFIDSGENKIRLRNDTLIALLQQPAAKIDTRKLQQLAISSYSYWPFNPALGAITAIKNELHLKQLSNSDISKLIARYENNTSLLIKLDDLQSDMIKQFVVTFLRQHFTESNLDAGLDGRPLDSTVRNLKQSDLTQFSIDLVVIKSAQKLRINYSNILKKQAVGLMDYVKKQYHLEE